MRVEILELTETKKKGSRSAWLRNGHLIVLTGMHFENRARAVVEYMVHSDIRQCIKKYECISERILKIEFSYNKNEIINILVVIISNTTNILEIYY